MIQSFKILIIFSISLIGYGCSPQATPRGLNPTSQVKNQPSLKEEVSLASPKPTLPETPPISSYLPARTPMPETSSASPLSPGPLSTEPSVASIETPSPAPGPSPEPTPLPVTMAPVLSPEEIPLNYQGKKNPYPWKDAIAREKGKVLFNQFCQGCHGIAGNLVTKADFTSTDMSDRMKASSDYFFWRVSEGKASGSGFNMPAFKELLKEEERWQIITYIQGLGSK